MNQPIYPEETAFSRLDFAFARFLGQRTNFDKSKKQVFETVVASLSQQQRQGHICIEVSETDKAILLESGFACATPRTSPTAYPLVIEDNRLYLQRYWAYEDRLATQIQRLANVEFQPHGLENLLDRHFPRHQNDTDWQREAAKLACQRALCILTGGPGTGKTTTVCKLLAIMQELVDPPLLIALSAPTGKAAMRLQESIALNLAALACSDVIKQHIPLTAITLHRLLGALPPSPYFKHDAAHPLVYDLVVVDEASMVDLALMSKLVDALKPTARLLLVGDKDQLASVESGAVLANLITGLPNHTVELKRSWRFDDGIKRLADAVNQQDYKTATVILAEGDESSSTLLQAQLLPAILGQREDYLALVKAKTPFVATYQAFNRFQVLCANRHGLNGSLAINNAIEQVLFGRLANSGLAAWYPGRPVMVTQNHPALQLYNGDVGLCLPDPDQQNNLMVFFQRPDGSIKKYLPARLPTCETAFAMTIHKAQGSEYEQVVVVLPDTVNPVLCKELLYTAITRAKKKVEIAAKPDVLVATINNQYHRRSGLSRKL